MTVSSEPVDLLDQEFVADPYPLYARLRQQRPVHRVRMRRGMQAWLVTRYDDAKAALADPRLLKDGARLRRLHGDDARRARSMRP